MSAKSVKVDNLEDREVAYIRFVGDYIGNSQIFESLINKLCQWAGPKGLMNEKTTLLSAYYDDPEATPREELKLDVCLSIPETTEVEGEIKKQVLPGGKYVVMSFELTEADEFKQAWQEPFKWLGENNHEFDTSKPCYELYLNNPKEHPENKHIVDICVGIK